jgi:hypothetical protein
MSYLLSEIQKNKFLETSGYEYVGESLKGNFMTEYPFNNREWEYSPWYFDFKFDQDNGFLICELDHRMTNNRTFGWDQDGNDLPEELVNRVYPPHI